MIYQLNKDLLDKKSLVNNIESKPYLYDSSGVDLSDFFNMELIKCHNFEQFTTALKNTILITQCFVDRMYDNVNYTYKLNHYYFKKLISDFIKLYVNYDDVEFIGVDYNPLFTTLVKINGIQNIENIYFEKRSDKYFYVHNGNPKRIEYTFLLKTRNFDYILYGCYILNFRIKSTNKNVRYMITYLSAQQSYKEGKVTKPLIKRIDDTLYNNLIEICNSDEYKQQYPELTFMDINDFVQ
jgi:hypothetical protein